MKSMQFNSPLINYDMYYFFQFFFNLNLNYIFVKTFLLFL